MLKKLIILTCILYTQFTYAARTDCPAAKIAHIQIERTVVLYRQEGFQWRRLESLSVADGTKERFSALLAAQAAGKKVMVGYPIDNFNCTTANYSDSAYIVRTYN